MDDEFSREAKGETIKMQKRRKHKENNMQKMKLELSK